MDRNQGRAHRGKTMTRGNKKTAVCTPRTRPQKEPALPTLCRLLPHQRSARRDCPETASGRPASSCGRCARLTFTEQLCFSLGCAIRRSVPGRLRDRRKPRVAASSAAALSLIPSRELGVTFVRRGSTVSSPQRGLPIRAQGSSGTCQRLGAWKGPARPRWLGPAPAPKGGRIVVSAARWLE